MSYRTKHLIEYGLLKGVAGFVRVLPYRAALSVGWLISVFVHWVCRYRVEMAKTRIREVFGGRLTEAEVARIAWKSFVNMCFVGIENFWMPRLSRKWVAAHLKGLDGENLRHHYTDGRGFIIATPHMGSWEVLGNSIHVLDYPMFYLYREQSNPLSDRLLRQHRESLGAQTIATDTMALRKGIKLLRGGSSMGILPDLRVKTRETPMPFLGRDANVGRGAAMFARSADVAIIPTVCRRVGWSHFEVTTLDPIRPDKSVPKEADWDRMTRELLDVLSPFILTYPDQYFWFNKRWVLEPLLDEPQ